ncbi:hypothetical protein [Pelagibius marinus]|uniref:hypothetical protein n=1 Tax=Pelagibius marinus TaxID=2762760 RepID=UPI001872FDB7|nr:hypothetical protein [Pelagibius marinus]
MLWRPLFAAIVLLAVAGCAYDAPVADSPAFNVYSSYSEKIPGRFALYVDDRKVGPTAANVRTYACSAHTFSIETGASFATSVHQTFRNLVDEIEVVHQPIAGTDLPAHGFTGMISVALEDAEFELTFIEGFWSDKVDTEAEYVARILVEGPQGRVLGTTVEASEDYRGAAGFACDGGSAAISQASSAALKELMERLGDRLVNAPRVRELTTAGYSSNQAPLNATNQVMKVGTSPAGIAWDGEWLAQTGPWQLYLKIENGTLTGRARHLRSQPYEVSGQVLQDGIVAGRINGSGGSALGSLSGSFPSVSIVQNGQIYASFELEKKI